MNKIVRHFLEWGKKTLSLEAGVMARQSLSSVILRYGDTTVLSTVTSSNTPSLSYGFAPLTVNFTAKMYSSGKIPGGLTKREGKPTDKEILTSRLIDRSIRPMFNKYYNYETFIYCYLLSCDPDSDPEISSLIAAAASLAASPLPLEGIIAGCRVGYNNENYILNPNIKVNTKTPLDLFVSATEDALIMAEAEVNELTKEIMYGAIQFACDNIKPVITLIKEFADEVKNDDSNTTIFNFSDTEHKERNNKIQSEIENKFGDEINSIFDETNKLRRRERLNQILEEILKFFMQDKEDDSDETTSDSDGFTENEIMLAFKDISRNFVRKKIVSENKRIDGRDTSAIRDIDIQIDILPRVHGSALFTRGSTQALAVVTLGTSHDEQIVDLMDSEKRERFLLHYNFPPFSVGEAHPLRPPSRREIGHGKLAWRAIRNIIPDKDDFAYTIRVVSDILESDGSSSMATVCSASLALMDTGVPIKSHIAGIALGLIKDGDNFCILTDILGDEDHLGDMDFKVAATKNGITALQMDVKLTEGLSGNELSVALDTAMNAIAIILAKMDDAIPQPRDNLKECTPRVFTLSIEKDKIRDVIGNGGRIIRDICDVSGSKIEINPDGSVYIVAANDESIAKAVSMINDIVSEPTIGEVYEGCVHKVTDFGIFIKFMGSRTGLARNSEISYDADIENIKSSLRENESIKVVIINIEYDNKIHLSIKRVNQETGEIIDSNFDDSSQSDAMPRRSSGGGGSGGRRFSNYNRSDHDNKPPRSISGDRYRSRDRGDSNRYNRNNDRDYSFRRDRDKDGNKRFGNNNPSGDRSNKGKPTKPRFF